MLDHVSRLLRFVGTFGFLGDCVNSLCSEETDGTMIKFLKGS